MKIGLYLFVELLHHMAGGADHEGYYLREEEPWGRKVLLGVDVGEYSSNSGNHSMTVDTDPNFVTSRHEYYVFIPLAHIYLSWGKVKVEGALDELPQELRNLLKRIDGLPGSLFGYNLEPLFSVIDRTHLATFAWWVHGSEHACDVLIVRAPRTEREAAEWMADWVQEKLPEYVAGSLGE